MGINYADRSRNIFRFGIRSPVLQVIRDQQKLAIRRNIRRDWFALNLNPSDLLPSSEIDDSHVVVEAITNVEELAIGAQHRAGSGMTRRYRIKNLGPGHVHDHNHGRGRRTCDVQALPIGRNRES